MPPGTGLRTVFDGACAARDLRPRIALQAGAADAVVDLAARGHRLAEDGDAEPAGRGDRVVVRAIDDVGTPALLALVWRSGRGPAVRELLAQCRRAFGVPGGPA
jgi:DNA-binding transcriptional LysR family regulator